MEIGKLLFWNTDTQNDFIEPSGKLYVRDAEKLKPVWAEITRLARKYKIKVVNTADYHDIHCPELDTYPDMVKTFPPHCLAGSSGADFIKETRPDNPLTFKWDARYDLKQLQEDILLFRNYVILKNEFDMFAGNGVTEPLVNELNPETVIVYGVTTTICVDYSVKGLVGLVDNVCVVADAIREIPNLPLPYDDWKKRGVKMITFEELCQMVSNQ